MAFPKVFNKKRLTKQAFSQKCSDAFRICLQLSLVIAIYYIGVGISYVLPIPIPGNILGMICLLVLLVTGILKDCYIKDACAFLLKYMAIFFLPAGVAVMECAGLLQGAYLKFALVCILTTIIVFAATSATVVGVSKLMARVKPQA